MTKLEWDKTGSRFYEAGVDRGVLYPTTPSSGAYANGVVWNGLTKVDENPEGGEESPLYADNIKYIGITSAERLKLSIEAYTYPEEFEACDGMPSTENGLQFTAQKRLPFGLCYRTKIGNDIDGLDMGYKIHLVYGCRATPSSRSRSTINESPEAVTFSWSVDTTPPSISDELSKKGFMPTAKITLDSTKIESEKMKKIEDLLYGSPSEDPKLPTIEELNTLLTSA